MLHWFLAWSTCTVLEPITYIRIQGWLFK
ncbi:hypothetical protein Gotri_011703 [Gossypium trilobum]|uniref:Uncharacterized protein n=1 Tax=Gossypium trilobum TaxID=34281 RepID=A0A7J9EUL9_9ROSI|nr:hypothetical protein [Gossypium trilobum]MBA0776749.1 hypothetical protein [Gossypium trilobum]